MNGLLIRLNVEAFYRLPYTFIGLSFFFRVFKPWMK